MIKIAIVEDDKSASDLLSAYLSKYESENGTKFSVSSYDNAVAFLVNGQAKFDVVFMDIDMPDLDGISASKKLREIDELITIVFVTNLRQYAISGYSVNALDFLVKPLTYTAFATIMNKVLKHIKKNITEDIVIKSSGGARRLSTDEIEYVETSAHRIFYRLTGGKTVESWGNLSDVEKTLPPDKFARCSSHYLVNLAHVKKIDGNILHLDSNTQLSISRNKKSAILSAFAKFLGA